MKTHGKIGIVAVLWLLLTLLWLCAMIELTTLVSYRHFFTAGELFAWVTANPYEVGDIAGYCLRYVLPYWLIATVVFLFAGWFIWRCVKKGEPKQLFLCAILEILLLLPFVALPLRSNIVREAVYVQQQVRNITCHQNDSKNFQYHTSCLDTIGQPEIVVLSIGESVRCANWSLNGEYERETTPCLKNQSNLCLYSDYYANATLTQHALPMLFTPVGVDDFEEHLQYKSIADAFHEAGFKTVLISHRAQLMNNGYHDYLAQNFDSVVFVVHDSLIAPELAKIARRGAKLFVVTHYLGNHMFYTNRTEDCLVWRPDYNADLKVESDNLFLNAYDNSLLYTDRLLNDVLSTLDSVRAVCSWLFISDHGEYIDSRVSGHGHTYHPTKDEYHVPLMVWYNDEYKATYPDKVANMRRHKDEPVCADHVFWSVLDMAGIRIDSTLQQDGMSIFEDTLLPHSRTLLLPDGKSIMNLD